MRDETLERAWSYGVSAARRRFLAARKEADALLPAAASASGRLVDICKFERAADAQFDALLSLASTLRLKANCEAFREDGTDGDH